MGLLGAALGGAAGYFLFGWLVQQGFYALLLPPAGLGFGAGLLARGRSVPLAIACAVLGLGLALFTEWKFRPFIADAGLGYFLTHVHELKPVTLIFVALGAYFSYRMALGSDRFRLPTPPAQPRA